MLNKERGGKKKRWLVVYGMRLANQSLTRVLKHRLQFGLRDVAGIRDLIGVAIMLCRRGDEQDMID